MFIFGIVHIVITVAELRGGEEVGEKSVRTYDNEQILDLSGRRQKLEKQKNTPYGVILRRAVIVSNGFLLSMTMLTCNVKWNRT